MKLRLGVIFGGVSVEHEVSIISAVQAMKHLNREKYEIIPIYIGKDKEWYTGNALKEIDIYSDIDLVKRYSKNVVLTTKKDKYVLLKKNGIKRIVDYVDLILPIVHGTCRRWDTSRIFRFNRYTICWFKFILCCSWPRQNISKANIVIF